MYRTEDNSVTKFVHSDGSETAIKCVPSQSSFIDADTGKITTLHTDRNKYSIFISISRGCFLKCPMCWLTIKDASYRRLSGSQILDNLKEAITLELHERPELSERYVKLSWMGMGDALIQSSEIDTVSLSLLDWMMDRGYTKGLDSVDISTVLPNIKDDSWMSTLACLNYGLEKYPHNPESAQIEQAELSTQQRYKTRSSVRLFYSIHSAIQPTRDKMAPNTMPLTQSLTKLKRFVQVEGLDLIFHQLFVKGINDSMIEVSALADILNTHFPNNELRILRYNKCNRSTYEEWPAIEQAFDFLVPRIKNLKVQISAGSEVSAACGQFLVTQIKERK